MKASQESSDEEPDYMSDNFLQQCVQNDIRPSLIHSRVEKRKHEAMTRQLENNKSKEEREKERIKSVEEAMKVPIGEDNKGFKMLQKMGYKPGSSIGKIGAEKPGGLKEPIKVDIKRGRGGLGQEQHQMEKIAKIISEGDPTEFRQRKQTVAKAREIYNDLRKAQFACHNLDEQKGEVKPRESWYWPEVKKNKKPDEGLNTDENETDVSAEDFHHMTKKKKLDDTSGSESEEDEEVNNIPDEIKLDAITNYLRDIYLYCLWCGVKYDSSDDINRSCPGTDKDDH